MTRQTGIIITIALAVVFGCCGLFSCIGGLGTLTGAGTYEFTDLTGVNTQGTTPPAYGLIGICFSLIFFLIPVAAWYFLVRGKTDTPAV